jgi:hypothetical protein
LSRFRPRLWFHGHLRAACLLALRADDHALLEDAVRARIDGQRLSWIDSVIAWLPLESRRKRASEKYLAYLLRDTLD